MAGYTNTPNMSLRLPIVFDDLNLWGNDLNETITTLDLHDHSPGKGLPVTSAGLEIDGDIDFNTFSILNLRRIAFYDPGASVTGDDLLYVKNGNLFYNDDAGNQIQITVGGFVNTTPSGNIIGLGGDDTIVFNDTTNALSFNADGVPFSMLLQTSEYQAGSQYTYGIGGTANTSFGGGQFFFNNGAPGNGILRYAKWFPDAVNSIDVTLFPTRFNFNTAIAGGANVRAATYESTASDVLDTTIAADLTSIGRLSVARDTATLIIQSNINLGSDTNGGSFITFRANDGAAASAGSIQYNAYGSGVGGSANRHLFYIRTGVDTVGLQAELNSTELSLTNDLVVGNDIDVTGTVEIGAPGGPVLSRTGSRLLVSTPVQIDNSTDGPILSRSAASELLVANALRLTLASGPRLSQSGVGGLLVQDDIKLKSTSLTLRATGTADAFLSTNNKTVVTSGNSGDGLIILTGTFDNGGSVMFANGLGAATHVSTGRYTVNFSTSLSAFSAAVTVIEQTAYIATWKFPTTGGVDVFIFDDAGVSTDVAFSIQIIGIA